MAGRGRGILRRLDDKTCEPLRRPGTKLSPKDGNNDVAIDVMLQKLNLSDYVNLRVPPSLANLTQNIKDEAIQQPDLKFLASVIVQFGIKGRQHSSVASQIVKELRPFSHNESKFLVEYLNILQVYFEAGDFSDKPKFLSYLTLLCETYHCLEHDGANPLCFLKNFILDLMGNLLTGGSDQEISTFVELVLKLCIDFSVSEWNDMMVNVRRIIISSKISEKSRSSLLQLLELSLKDWNPLSKNVTEVYNSYH